jgi:hypothetical protein
VQFRLTYTGCLPSHGSSGHKAELRRVKHSIRRQIHAQLLDLCTREPTLLLVVAGLRGSPEISRALPQIDISSIKRGWASWQDFKDVARGLFQVGEKFRFGGFEFVPLVVDALAAVCELDILFLRRERPGSLILKPKDEYGGDLDNRIKFFLDALRCPTSANELPKEAQPEEGELPFLCLLEDDSLITKFQVESDTLLGQMPQSNEAKDVQLVVRVTIKFTRKSRLSALLP